MKKLFTTIITILTALFLKAQLAGGVYTIDKNSSASPTNFTSFNAAYNAIKTNGITGAVTFNVVVGSGPYKEHLVINGKIPNSSATNSITFNGNGEVIANNALVSNTFYPIITLSNVNHIQLTNLVITTDTFSTIGVLLSSNADSNFIMNCTIKIDTTKNSPSNFGFTTGGIVISSSTSWSSLSDKGNNCDANKIYNNQIYGGTYGLAIASNNDSGTCNNNEIYSNSFYDFLSYGLYSSGTNNLKIYKNNFSRPARIKHASYLSVIYVTSVNDNLKISQNKIFNCYGSGNTQNFHEFRGINFENYSSISMPATVDNNVIYGITTIGSQYGILINSLPTFENARFLHNTISFDDTLVSTLNIGSTYGIDVKGGGGLFYNNIISITRGGSVRKVGFAQSPKSQGCDFNVYYINSLSSDNYVALDNWTTTFYSTLTSFQAATQSDSNSVSVNPFYKNPNPTSINADFTPTNFLLSDKGKPVGINYDINNNIRSITKPDIGAHEYNLTSCDPLSLNGKTQFQFSKKWITKDTILCKGSSVILNVIISGGYGLGQLFQWQRVTDTTSSLIDNFLPAITHPDTAIIVDKTPYFYRCKIVCGTSFFYTSWLRIEINIPAIPAGTYTINKNVSNTYVNGVSGGNFSSFNIVANRLNTCGIDGTGNVIFNVISNSGPYMEQFKLDTIYGVSNISKVFFNGNGNTIAFPTPTTPTSREGAVVKLNRADYIIIDSLVIDASTTTTNYGYGIHLLNNADNNVFSRCVVKSSSIPSSNYNYYACVLINGRDSGWIFTVGPQSLCDSNIFINNKFTGGIYSICIDDCSSIPIYKNKFLKNRILDFYYSGYVSWGGSVDAVIANNFFSRPTRDSVNMARSILLYSSIQHNLIINANTFTNFFGNNTNRSIPAYAIYFDQTYPVVGKEIVITNNLFYKLGSATSNTAFYNYGASNIFFHHNTIILGSLLKQDSLANHRCLSGSTSATINHISFKNNLVYFINGGTGSKKIFENTSTAKWTVTNNILYAEPLTANMNLGNYKDSNYYYNPYFVDTANLLYIPQNFAINNKGANVGVTTDFLGNFRNVSTPDIGAYEFTPTSCPTIINSGFSSVVPNSGTCLGQSIKLSITGNNGLGVVTYQWQDSIAGGNWQDFGSVRDSASLDTITTPRNFYRCIISCYNDPFLKIISPVCKNTLNNYMPGGSYTINKSLPTTFNGSVGGNFSSFTEAINAMQCGITGPIFFNVYAGTYNEQITLKRFHGNNSINTITFQSVNSMASSVIINFTTGSNIATIKFDSVHYVSFKNLTINNNASTSGRVIELSGTSSNISILNCVINANKYQSTSLNNAAIYANLFKGSYITLKGNAINNGSFGIYLAGTAATSGNLTKPGHIIDNNTITNSYSSGIFVQFADRIAIANNIIFSNDTTANNSSCIYANYCDSGFTLLNNKININNNVNGVTGIQIQNSRNRIKTGFGIIANNEVYANANNKGKILGMSISASDSLIVKNNVISINTGALNSIGLANANNVLGSSIFYYNNTVQIAIVDTNSIAAQITQSNAGNFIFKNNIFSNLGNGKAIYVNNATNIISDYNLIYSSGNTFANTGTLSSNYFQNINKWRTTTQLDKNSIIFKPSFISNVDLSPNIADSNVWAMQGRGIQIKGNDKDINGNYRPDSLTAGVPDIGAYEFLPTIAPPSCNATPANPTPNTTQTFYLGSDTVMRIKWKGSVPNSAAVRLFSGLTPPNINKPSRLDSMFFYTKVDIPFGSSYNCDVELKYLDSWLGSFSNYYDVDQQLGLGTQNSSGNWFGRGSSNVIGNDKFISDYNLSNLDKLTGLYNNLIICPNIYFDTSNIGRDFWLAYPANQLAGAETYQLYFNAQQASKVNVQIPGTGYSKTYNVPANSVLTSDVISKGIRHQTSGVFNDAINITSDNPISVWAHTYGSVSAAMTNLYPSSILGYKYQVLSKHIDWGGFSYPFYYVIATNNNTKVVMQNNVAVQGRNQIDTVILNKGQWIQVLANDVTDDLTGSIVQSVANSNNICYPIAVFTGDTRTLISSPCSGGGDFLMQQNLPKSHWGKNYLTAPTSQSSLSTNFEKNLFRINIQNVNQNVYVNGVQIYPINTASGCLENYAVSSSLTPNTMIPAYIEFTSLCANYITSDAPIQVAQFLSGACAGDGDPELMYLTPIENSITNANIYRTNLEQISTNYVTLIGSNKDTPRLCEGNPCNNLTWTHIYAHPNFPNTNVYIKQWATSAQKNISISSDYKFTGISYGLGSVESYGYNLGANFSNNSEVVKSSLNKKNYCIGDSLYPTVFFNSLPDSIVFFLSGRNNNINAKQASFRKPYTQISIQKIINSYSDTSYKFILPGIFKVDSAGYYYVTTKAFSNSYGACDNSSTIQQTFPVYSNPKIYKLTTNSPVLLGDSIRLFVTNDSLSYYNYSWSGPNSFTSINQNPTIANANNLNAGIYKVVVSDNICSLTDSTVVIVNAGGSLSIAGQCISPLKKNINNVRVDIKNGIQNTLYSNLSNYQFSFLPSGLNYTIRPTKNNDITKANGVTSIDALLTQRHILNTTKLNSPYKIIAADVDGNKLVNSIDVLRMKRLILGTDTTFTKTVGTVKTDRLWEFVDSAYTFPDTTNPFPFKDSISFTNLTSNKTNQTFIGVKLGDVNYDWNPTVARGVAVNNLELVYHVISTKEQSNQTDFSGTNLRNDELRMPVTSSNFNNIAALQTTLHFDNTKYEFVSLESNKLQIDYNASKANKTGNIAVLWTDKNAEAKSFDKDEVLFTVVLKPRILGIGNLELVVSNDMVETEAWDNNFTKRSIVLTQKSKSNKQEIQNNLLIYPNPAKDKITIESDGAKRVYIIDCFGRQVIDKEVVNNKLLIISSLHKGVYIVKAIMKNGTQLSSKLICL